MRHVRLFWATLALLMVSVAAPSSAADPVTVAGVFYAKVTEGNWDPAGHQAFTAMARQHGFKSIFSEESTYDKAPEIIADFASRGANLIIAHSSGYASAVLDAAPNFPKTTFAVVSALASTKGLPNVNGWSFKWQEVGFLAGVVAGLTTETNKVGVVAADVIPAFTQAIAGYIEGVKYANPKATVTVSWVGSFTDAAKAKQLTLAQVSQGIDVVAPWADTAEVGVFEAARQAKIKTFGMYSDERSLAPEVIISSVTFNFNRVYEELGNRFAAGTLKSEIYPLTIGGGYIGMTDLNHVSPEVKAKVEAIIADIKSGKIVVSSTDYKP